MEHMDHMCAETIVDIFKGKRLQNILNPAVFESDQNWFHTMPDVDTSRNP